jgi:hypothetical protein
MEENKQDAKDSPLVRIDIQFSMYIPIDVAIAFCRILYCR